MLIAQTDRLFLRHFHIADGDALDRVFGDPEVMHFGSKIQSPDWVRNKFLPGCLEDYHRKWGFGLYAVVQKNSGQVLGFCGLTHFADVAGKPEIEIGYRLARAHWGLGFATEAAGTVREYAFQTLSLPRVISIIHPQNQRSIRVAQKIGMRFEKEITFHNNPAHIYSAHVNR
jgi:[ribosomal protein S5]-alanine N-acetyltransferase